MDDLDTRLRAIASASLDREAAATPVDDDLAAVRARAADRSESRPDPRRSWARLAVAATLVLFATGAVALLATRSGGDEVVAPPATEVPSTGTAPEPSAPTTSVVSDMPLGLAEPVVVGPGMTVTITPAGEVRRNCQDIAFVDLRTGDGFVYQGLVAPYGWDTSVPPDVPACEGELTAAPLEVRVPDALGRGDYRFCIAGDDAPEGCALVEVRGVLTSTTVPTPTSTTVTPTVELAVGYVERRYVDEPPYFELREVAPDGSVVGQAGRETIDELLRREIATGVGGNVRLLPEVQPYGRCDAREVAPGGLTTEVVPELAAPVRSMAATEAGVVVVGVDVCPDGTTWGDLGTRFELRRIDLATGTTTVLHVREPGDGDTFFEDLDVVYAGGELVVESVSPDGAFVAVAEPYTTEDTRYHVFDAVTGGEPLSFASACEDPRVLVGPPQFVGDGLVVLARECSPVDGETGDLVVELVSLETREPVWSASVDHVEIDSYSSTVSLDAGVFDGRVWALVSGSAGVEQPIRAAAVTEGVEQPLPGGAIVAFDPQELIEPWDPYPG